MDFPLVFCSICTIFAPTKVLNSKFSSMQSIESGNKGEIVMYQPDETIRLEVRVENETVWLTQQQMAELFLTTRNNITLHIGNIFKEGELDESSVRKDSLLTAADGKKYRTKIYNLDVIISVGYRVKSKRGTQFRQWANQVLKDYLLKGYAVNQRIEQLERRVTLTEEKIDFFVHKSLPPVEGIFFDGQIFDAYVQIVNLIKQAKKSIILVDNYVDETTLIMLSKRNANVSATIYTKQTAEQFRLDVQRHNQQYPPIAVNICQRNHDRFLIIDNVVYLFGASLKDAGKKLFAYIKMQETSADELLSRIR